MQFREAAQDWRRNTGAIRAVCAGAAAVRTAVVDSANRTRVISNRMIFPVKR